MFSSAPFNFTTTSAGFAGSRDVYTVSLSAVLVTRYHTPPQPSTSDVFDDYCQPKFGNDILHTHAPTTSKISTPYKTIGEVQCNEEEL